MRMYCTVLHHTPPRYTQKSARSRMVLHDSLEDCQNHTHLCLCCGSPSLAQETRNELVGRAGGREVDVTTIPPYHVPILLFPCRPCTCCSLKPVVRWCCHLHRQELVASFLLMPAARVFEAPWWLKKRPEQQKQCWNIYSSILTGVVMCWR